jgi:hypothetical protein
MPPRLCPYEAGELKGLCFGSLGLKPIRWQAKGIDHPSFTATLLKSQDRHGLDERQMAWLASTM